MPIIYPGAPTKPLIQGGYATFVIFAGCFIRCTFAKMGRTPSDPHDLLVVDTSFTIRLPLPNPRQKDDQDLMTQWHQEGYTLCAPTLWLYKVTTALCKGVHFGQLTREEGQHALGLAQDSGVQLVPPDADLAGLEPTPPTMPV